MGRVTEFIEFINADEIPTDEEMNFMYSHITKTEKLKKIRKEYRKKVKESKNGNEKK
tara:strand:- start:35 stop:205 length:171 start_codon:yes stop_codon:yes gene_type:complete